MHHDSETFSLSKRGVTIKERCNARINLVVVRALQWKTTKNTAVVDKLVLLFTAVKGERTPEGTKKCFREFLKRTNHKILAFLGSELNESLRKWGFPLG